MLFGIIDWKDKDFPLVYLRYIVKGNLPIDVKAVPHGNSKGKGNPYYRTKQSAKNKIIETAKLLKPKDAYHKIFKEVGGVQSCTSVGDAPRNYKQISNACYKLSDPQPCKDSLHEIARKCPDDQSHSDPNFIHSFQAAPEPTCVLADNYQLNDIEHCCRNSAQFSILGIDPTFNIVFINCYDLYRHLFLRSK